MEEFFEKLNGGDREAAVALMDEKTEMRVHVGDSVRVHVDGKQVRKTIVVPRKLVNLVVA